MYCCFSMFIFEDHNKLVYIYFLTFYLGQIMPRTHCPGRLCPPQSGTGRLGPWNCSIFIGWFLTFWKERPLPSVTEFLWNVPSPDYRGLTARTACNDFASRHLHGKVCQPLVGQRSVCLQPPEPLSNTLKIYFREVSLLPEIKCRCNAACVHSKRFER